MVEPWPRSSSGDEALVKMDLWSQSSDDDEALVKMELWSPRLGYDKSLVGVFRLQWGCSMISEV